MAVNAHFTHHFGHGMRAELLHKIRGYIIGRVSKTPFEGNRLAYPFIFVGGAGCPFGAVGGEKTLRHANSLVAGVIPSCIARV